MPVEKSPTCSPTCSTAVARGRPTKRISLTRAAIEHLPPPASSRIYIYDAKLPGFAVCITRAGCRTFYLIKRIGRQVTRLRIGAFPAVTVDEARRAAQALAGEIARGVNPQEERRQARLETEKAAGDLAFGELFDWYLKIHARPKKKPRSCREDERLYARHLEPWARRRASTITTAAVAGLHARLRGTPYEANHVLALVSGMFTKARELLHREGPNPAAGIAHYHETSRERFLQPDELPRFLKALHDEPKIVYRDFFLVCLFTGARRGNVQSMLWTDLNLADGLWTVPDTKSGRPQAVVLHPHVVAILAGRQAAAGESPWVFPGRLAGRFLGEPGKQWKIILDRAGITNLRIHDLRRTLGSWAAAGGVSLPIIGKFLGHHDQATTQIYARLTLEPLRQAIGATVDALLAAGEPKEKDAAALPPK